MGLCRKRNCKSFFSGTIAFILLIVFWGLGDIDTITKWINRVDLTTFVPKLIVAYAGFMIVYLLITALIYCARYAKGYRKMKAYGNHLKRARRLLREGKIKGWGITGRIYDEVVGNKGSADPVLQ